MKTPAKCADFLANDVSYQQWRKNRLDSYPEKVYDIIIGIETMTHLTGTERKAILMSCRSSNMAIYRCHEKPVDRSAIKTFAAQLGLERLDYHLCSNPDGVSELEVAADCQKSAYVPYSNRSLSWHTDGYYNQKPDQVNAVVLHCDQSAGSGGENALLDPELAYIHLRDEDPRYIKALEHPGCMLIPENRMPDGGVRAAVAGPVFSYDVGGRIHMRFSARRKNIQWREDTVTREARQCLLSLLADENGPVFRYRLQAGEGLVSNNVLHNRTTFSDHTTQKRLLYRARYFDRIETS